MYYTLGRCEQKVRGVILPKDRGPRFVTIRRGGSSLIRITSSSPYWRHRARSASLTFSSRLGLKTHGRVRRSSRPAPGCVARSRCPADMPRGHPPEFEYRGPGCHDWVLRGEVAKCL